MDTNEKLLELIVEKLVRIDQELKQLNSTSIIQTQQLAEHMRRSELLEEQMKLERQRVALEFEQMNTSFAPALKMTQAIGTGFKLFGAIIIGIAGVAGFTVTVLQIISHFKK